MQDQQVDVVDAELGGAFSKPCRVVVDSAAGDEWGLGVRVPHWVDSASALVNGEPATAEPQDGWLTVTRRWAAGDEFVLNLPLEVRFTYADTRVDATRGSIALERGPLVYCLEAADNPGQRLDDIVIDTASAPVVECHADLLGGVTTIRVQGRRRSRPNESWWLYGSKASRSPTSPGSPDHRPVRRSVLLLGQPR